MTSGIGHRLEKLTPEQIRQLVKRSRRPGAEAPLPAIVPQESRDGKSFPMSSAQQRMWFLSQLSPDAAVYNNPVALAVSTDTPFDIELLGKALRAMVLRHEALRTTFRAVDGEPRQTVHSDMAGTVEYVDVRSLPSHERTRQVTALAVEEGRQPFDLATGPLLRFKVLRQDERDYVLLITTHHIISDGWSNALFARELAEHCNAIREDRPPRLPPVQDQYVDYTLWEREWLNGPEYRESLAYWKQKLGRTLFPLDFPTDRPRPPILTFSGGVTSRTIPAPLLLALQALSRSLGITLFNTLLCAFKVLLFRYTGQMDLVVGTPVANRNRRRFQGVLGLFLNTLALRTKAEASLSFRAYAHQVADTCNEALRHQEVPFDKLVEELDLQRDLASHPVFQVLFVHQNVPNQYAIPGMSFFPLKVDYGSAKFDLNLWVEEVDGTLQLALKYYRDLFEHSTAERILGHYENLLHSIVADPAQSIARLSLLDPSARLTPFDAQAANAGSHVSSGDTTCVHRRFEELAASQPEREAALCPRRRLTYGELNASANELAHRLRALGVRRDARVGLLAERGAEMLIGLLGILKAGGAYVPLDTAGPPARTRFVLEDSACEIVVCATRGRERAPDADLPATTKQLHLHNVVGSGSACARENPDFEVRPDDLAYVVYTSGTTGRPKGVCVEHRQIASYADGIWEEMRLSPGDRMATISSIAADLGNTSIFAALTHGASVQVIPYELASAPHDLALFLAHAPADFLKIVPSHLEALLATDDARAILPRKLLMLGGEACPFRLVEKARRLAPGLRVMNHYGPSEATVGVTAYHVPDDLESIRACRSLPLGRALPHAEVYVLDEYLQPVPKGVPGEIFAGGQGVARGYWNRPQMTAERFLPHPFGSGRRWYRTGDRGRFCDDDCLEYLGRLDRQVKIRGYRVELEEIESVIREHECVTHAAVVMRPSEQLVAFVVLGHSGETGREADIGSIQSLLEERLPAHMQPRFLVPLETMPLTRNGKVDYGALPPVPSNASTSLQNASKYHPPRDVAELRLCRIWEEVLAVDTVGIDDGFFDLGGHSLLAVRLLARIRAEFGTPLDLAVLFRGGTVRQLGELLRRGESPGSQNLVRISQSSSGSSNVADSTPRRHVPLFLVHPAGGNVLCYFALSRSLKRPVFGLQALPEGTARQDTTTIEEMARQYLRAIEGNTEGSQVLLGGWSMGAAVAFEMARHLRSAGRHPIVAVLDQIAPCGPVVRAEDDADHLANFANKIRELYDVNLALPPELLRSKAPMERSQMFLDAFVERDIVPADTSLSDFHAFLELQRAHNEAIARYRPDPAGFTVGLFRARDRRFSVAPIHPLASSPDFGWGQLTHAPVDVIHVPGNHISMMTAPHVSSLAEELSSWIAKRTED